MFLNFELHGRPRGTETPPELYPRGGNRRTWVPQCHESCRWARAGAQGTFRVESVPIGMVQKGGRFTTRARKRRRVPQFHWGFTYNSTRWTFGFTKWNKCTSALRSYAVTSLRRYTYLFWDVSSVDIRFKVKFQADFWKSNMPKAGKMLQKINENENAK